MNAVKRKLLCRRLFLSLVFFFMFSAAGCGAADVKQEPASAAAEGTVSVSSEEARNLLAEYIEEDTRIIYVNYDGIDDDMVSYRSDAAEAITDEEQRAAYIRGALGREHLLAELTDAFANREEQVCIVGMFFSGLDGYMNSMSLGLDGGMIRTLPYSTFWLKSYSGLRGFFPKGESSFGERWFVYNLEYYPITDEQIGQMKTEIDREAEEILSCIPEEADRWTRHRLVHDELIRRITYDTAYEDHCHDLYGALVKHEAVCEGYALAYRYILEKLGYSCDVVISNWDEENKGHAWNRIYAPTYEEYIDVTWDDPDETDEYGEPFVEYGFFGLTKEEIEAIDSHTFDSGMTGWFAEPEPFNYYRHEGYMLDSGDEEAITDLFYRQYYNGANCLTVRFEEEETYREAMELLANGDELNRMLTEVGYYGRYWYRADEELRIFSIGLMD